MNIVGTVIAKTFQSSSKAAKIIGCIFTLSILGFCYYSILVSVASVSLENSNDWILFYIYSLLVDIFTVNVFMAIFKHYFLLKSVNYSPK